MRADPPPFVLNPQPFPNLHWRGTEGARHVNTPQYRKTYLAIEAACRIQGIVAVIGDPGLGKTHDCGLAVARLHLVPAYYGVGPKPLGKEFEEGAIYSLAKDRYNYNNPRRVMKRDLKWAAATHALVWTLDDVERSEGYGIELVRHIWAQPTNKLTFVLVGNNLMQFLDANPALRDRVARLVHYHPMTPAESVAYGRSYHPMYEHAPESVVTYVENETAHGIARQWAQITETLLSEGFDYRTAKLTLALVDDAIAMRFQI